MRNFELDLETVPFTEGTEVLGEMDWIERFFEFRAIPGLVLFVVIRRNFRDDYSGRGFFLFFFKLLFFPAKRILL